MRTPCCKAFTHVQNKIEMCLDCGLPAETGLEPIADIPKPYLLTDQLAVYDAEGGHIGHLIDVVNLTQWNAHVDAAIKARDAAMAANRSLLGARR